MEDCQVNITANRVWHHDALQRRPLMWGNTQRLAEIIISCQRLQAFRRHRIAQDITSAQVLCLLVRLFPRQVGDGDIERPRDLLQGLQRSVTLPKFNVRDESLADAAPVA